MFALFGLLILIISWRKDIILEALSGFHNFYVEDCLKYGFMLFIFREFIFFFSIFWFFFDSALRPGVLIFERWIPYSVNFLNPFGAPFLNTCILLRRGVRVTFSHYSLLTNKDRKRLLITIILSALFLYVQYREYNTLRFSISDRVFGRIFFLSTGFHGIHVLLGTIFLLLNYIRLKNKHFSYLHHNGLEFAIIYWHFVDVVWLFLFIFVYWWNY